MSDFIASVQRYSMDLRFKRNAASTKAFDNDLTELLKRYSVTSIKKTRIDVTNEYADETITETCKCCGKEVQVYLMRPSFCMSCGNRIYPCSLCSTCTKCNEEKITQQE